MRRCRYLKTPDTWHKHFLKFLCNSHCSISINFHRNDNVASVSSLTATRQIILTSVLNPATNLHVKSAVKSVNVSGSLHLHRHQSHVA